jgi:hypothetical protein
MKMKKIIFLPFMILVLNSCIDLGKDNVDLIPVSSGDKIEYIDREGKIQINPQFETASVYHNGLALVKTSGENSKYGYISEEGKFVISAKYLEATVFNDEIAWVVEKNGCPTAINTKGKVLFKAEFAEKARSFKNGFAPFQQIDTKGDLKWGFISKEGKVVINPQFENVGHFNNGKCPVQNNKGKWGFINEKGLINITYQFDYAGSFDSKGHAIVKLTNKFGVIDEDGKYLINPLFSMMKTDGDIFLIEQDNKYGWCDEDGEILINPQFENAFPFSGSKLAAVESASKWGYINKEGKFDINPQFTGALPFDDDLAMVEFTGKIGFINLEGKFEINPQFESVSYDYITYISSGKSMFNSVSTDFFNVDAITKTLNTESPENFTFNSTFGDVQHTYFLSENDFNDYTNIQQVINEKKITKDAYLSFYVGGKVYEQVSVERGDAWYTYTETENVFKQSNKLNFFRFEIHLTGKGYGKESDLIKAIENKLIGYTKNTNKSNSTNIYYDNGNKIVLLQKNADAVTISIYKLSDSMNYEYIDESYNSYSSYESENCYEPDFDSEYYGGVDPTL